MAGRGTITESDLRLIDGKLTVSRAPLTVTARDYTIMQGDPLPDFEADFTGFKSGSLNASKLARNLFQCWRNQPQSRCTMEMGKCYYQPGHHFFLSQRDG